VRASNPSTDARKLPSPNGRKPVEGSMKLAIDILMEKRDVLYKNVKAQTENVKGHLQNAKAQKESAEYYLNESRKTERAIERACLVRNECQAQLNVIDSAIEKLQS